MSADKRWLIRGGSVDGERTLWWESGPLDPTSWFIDAADFKNEEIGFGDKAEDAFDGLIEAVCRADRDRKVAELVGNGTVCLDDMMRIIKLYTEEE